jgi:predicted DNA-binding protein with PD1-like motif
MPDDIYNVSRTFFVRVDTDAELMTFLNKLAVDRNVTNGSLTAIGALKSAKLSFFNQETREFVELADLKEPQELISCMGIITVRDGKPTAHAHVVLADADGTTRAGHLVEATVFFTQVCVHQLEPAQG